MSQARAKPDDLAALERFVVENDDLLALEERIGRFNIFDALGIARAEIRHSNFLAWLLDPAESHGQGDLFLKALLMDLARHAREQGLAPSLSPVHLDGADMGNVEIRREWKNIDLLIVSVEPSIVIVIENKIDSAEHSDQLQRYERTVAAEFPGQPALFVFLTPGGSRASDNRWVSYSYADVHRVLSRVRRTNSGSVGPDVAAFLDHYLRLIEGRMMEDPQIAELCRRIYKNHRAAIDLIVEHADVGGSGFLGPVAEAVETLPGGPWVFPNRTGRWFRCIPEAWTKIIPTIAQQVPNPHALLFYEILVDTSRCTVVTLDMAPCSDRELRLRLVEHLRSEAATLGLKTNFKATIESEWTRLFSTHPYRWKDDPNPEELVDRTLDSVRELLGKVDRVTDSLRRFFKGVPDVRTPQLSS